MYPKWDIIFFAYSLDFKMKFFYIIISSFSIFIAVLYFFVTFKHNQNRLRTLTHKPVKVVPAFKLTMMGWPCFLQLHMFGLFPCNFICLTHKRTHARAHAHAHNHTHKHYTHIDTQTRSQL